MKKSVAIITGIIVVVIIAIITMYNGMVKTEEEVNNKYSGIETTLQRRADLIPNLVNTVKGYASHETEVFASVNESREKLMGANTPEELANAELELNFGKNIFGQGRFAYLQRVA